MENFTHSFNKRIKWIYFLLLLLAIVLSATVYLRGEKIRHTAEQLITQDIPTYDLFRQYQTQLNDQERYLYEYYATIDEEYFSQGYMGARRLANEHLLVLNQSFGYNTHLQQAQNNMQIMDNIAQQFHQNMLGKPVNWDLAREQLAQLSDLRRLSIELVTHLTNITADKVNQSKHDIQDELWQVRGFVLVYGLITILIAIMVGRGIKAYIAASATSNRLSLFPKRNPNPIISLDEANRAIFSNPATQKMLLKLELEAEHVHCLLPENLDKYQQEVKDTDSHFKRYEYQIKNATLECELHWLADEKQWDIHLTDVSARKQAELELQFQAFHHRETALENEYALRNSLDLAAAQQHSYLLLLLEVHQFSLILSNRGYEMTHALIKELALLLQDLMQDSILSNGRLFHISSSKFAIQIIEPGQKQSESDIYRFIEASLKDRVFQCMHQLELDYGFAHFPQHGHDSSSVSKSAFTALEQAGHREQDHCVVFTHELGQKVAYELDMIANIRQAMNDKQFELYFQPQLSIQNDQVVGLEVLIRWQHQGKWISPGEFIPLAEKSGLIVPLGDWILNTACEKAKHFIDSGYEKIVVAVNISPKQFNRDDFVEKVKQALTLSQLPAKNLELEITEGVIMYNEVDTIERLRQLKRLGVMLSIDDFGTGYSSLSYLKQFPVDKLKIDQSFVRHLQSDEDDRSIVRTVIDLGNNLSLKLIAEGVEESSQLQLLKQMGCHEIQGYFFSRPLPEPELVNFLHNRQAQPA